MNYLFNSQNTFNDCSAILYEAMYEQSQMEVKILEAIIKADSLSRKYRAQGIYTESAIQAFNEEADNTIFNTIKRMVSSFVEKVKEWWTPIRRRIGIMIDWFMSWIRKIFKNDKKSDNNANTITIDYNKEVEWCDISLLEEYYNQILKYNTTKKSPNEILMFYKKNSDTYDSDKYVDMFVDMYTASSNDLVDEMQKRFRDSIKIVKLKDIPVDSFNEAQKIVKVLKDYRSETDKIVNGYDKYFKDCTELVEKNVGNKNAVKVLSAVLYYVNNYLRNTSSLFKELCEKDINALVEKYKNKFKMPATKQEMASILVEAAMYEFMTAVDNTSPIVDANDIKRFAAAKLEAAMDEINDVIDHAINHNAYQS